MAVLVAAVWVSACSQQDPYSSVTPVAAQAASSPGPVASASPMQPVALKGDCAAALAQMKQCHQKAVAGGKGSPKRLEQSGIYLRRLQAWWEKDPGNSTLLASCRAMVSDGGMGCEFSEEPEDAEDEAEFDAQFKMMMEQFDKAGVPR